MDIIYSFILSNWIGLLTILIGIPSAIVCIKQIKSWKKASDFVTNSPGETSKICIGRSADIKKVRRKILNEKPIFIYGSAGIGKTTLVNSAIRGIKKKLSNKYDRVLCYDFAKNPDKEHAINTLCDQIPQKGTNGFPALISEKKYIIRLEGCENTTIECLEDIVKASDNPVFIICSRDLSQAQVLQTVDDSDDLVITLSTLPPKSALVLLMGFWSYWNPFNKTKKRINRAIVEFVACHPFSVYNIKINRLFKRNPFDFYNLLKNKGLNSSIDDTHPFIFKQKYNMELLLKLNFELEIVDNSQYLSAKSKKALGFLGFLSEEAFPYQIYQYLFDSDVVEEIIKTNLFISVKLGKIKAIKSKHSLVNEVLYNNCQLLMDGDYSYVFDFLSGIISDSIDSNSEYSNDIYNFARLSYSFIKNHISHCTHKLICNEKIPIDGDENAVWDKYSSLVYSLLLLSTFGMYDDVLDLSDRFYNRFSQQCPENLLDELNQVRFSTFEGLEMYEKAIECQHNLISRSSDPDVLVMYYNNIIEDYIYLKQFQNATNAILKHKEFLEKNKQSIDEKSYLEVSTKIRFFEQAIIWYQGENIDFPAFIQNLTSIVDDTLKLFPKDDFSVIKPLVFLVFAYAKINPYAANKKYQELLRSLEKWILSPGYFFIMNQIADFFFDAKAYNRAQIALRNIFERAIVIFGNEHAITKRIRDKLNLIAELKNEDQENMNE